jgi:hypothetical protein
VGIRTRNLEATILGRPCHVDELRATVRDWPGKLFTPHLLDISRYTGERRRRELEMISIRKRSELDKFVAAKIVLDVEQMIREQLFTI